MIDQETAHDYFIPAGEGSRHAIFPGVEILTTSGAGLMFSVVTMEPNSVVMRHSHAHEQMGILISGRLEFTIGEITKIVEPGDIWLIPSNVPHKVVTLDAKSVALDVFHPIREDYR